MTTLGTQLCHLAMGLTLVASFTSCASGGGGGSGLGSNTSGRNGFESEGSEPMNNAEGVEYKRAILRCHKNGGSRIVKVEGELRCY